MHIVFGLLTLATAFFIAYRRFHEAGFSSSDINPFLFFRRRAWQKRRYTNPLFILENNKDVASVLLFIIAKLDGEMTRETKLSLEDDYRDILKMNTKEASETLQQNSYLLEQYPIVRQDLKKILHKECLARFSDEQATQLLRQIEIVAERESPVTQDQQQWINDIATLLAPNKSQLF